MEAFFAFLKKIVTSPKKGNIGRKGPQTLSPWGREVSSTPVCSSPFFPQNSPRLSPEKGVGTLLSVASKLPYTLKIAGDGPIREKLEEQFKNANNIEFLGHQNPQQVAMLLSKARFSVMPSECYDNNPLGVIESLCAGTPVVGARAGGIPELLNTMNGIIFTSGNREELANAIKKAFDTEWNNNIIKEKDIRREYSSMGLYERIRERQHGYTVYAHG